NNLLNTVCHGDIFTLKLLLNVLDNYVTLRASVYSMIVGTTIDHCHNTTEFFKFYKYLLVKNIMILKSFKLSASFKHLLAISLISFFFSSSIIESAINTSIMSVAKIFSAISLSVPIKLCAITKALCCIALLGCANKAFKDSSQFGRPPVSNIFFRTLSFTDAMLQSAIIASKFSNAVQSGCNKLRNGRTDSRQRCSLNETSGLMEIPILARA
ncbi:hypothetical protein AGLY_001983, partial [Aphis glycines]